ncbi:MAG: DUF5675 family protein, partial [Balneolaceae bacterium]
TELTKETFTGKELDEETGMYYFGARYYDAALGRWSVTDPAGQYPTPYGYAGNSPIMNVDRDGRIAWFAPLIIGAAVGGGSGYFVGKSHGAKGWDLAGYIAGGAAIGAVSAGIGSAVSGFVAASTGLSGFAGGTVSGAAGGAAGGFVSGAGFAGMSGQNPLRGGVYGAIGGGITGGIFGGINRGIEARMNNANFWNGKVDISGMMAYEYVVDQTTGSINKISDLGGAGTHYYHFGGWTDGGTAFLGGGGTIVADGINTINMFRFMQTASSTISAFSIPASGAMGYFLEPKGPSTSTANLNRRIPTGTYNVIDHSGTNFKDVYKLYNKNVSQSRSILIHSGNFPKNTQGCLLPGSSCSTDFVGNSKNTLGIINAFIKSKGVHKVTINIYEVFK